MARLLIVEDEAALARALARGLSDAGHTVEMAADGETALVAIARGQPEVVVLDVMLPKVSGLEVCGRMRAAGNAVPVLMLTARDATEDVVKGLDAGANDYLTKPFAFQELLARIRALLRVGTPALSAELCVGDLRVDTAAHEVRLGSELLALSPKEYQLLEVLLRHKGTVVSRQRLAEALWHGHSNPDSNAMEVHVASLRKKLEPEGNARLLHTVRGFGYVLREPGGGE
jgi:two-component system, OmpR family, response regulator MprA